MSSEWDQIASLRRRQIESGQDLTFSKVFVPFYRDILGSLRSESILEVGAGTGHLAFELRDLTARYVCLEPSEGMFLEAQDVLREKQLELIQAKLEDWKPTMNFDLVIAHMCLQTIEDHHAFFESIKQLLNLGGAFLIAIPHPAFFNAYKNVIPEDSYSYMREHGTVIDFTITLDPSHPIQRVPYFHRSLSSYVAAVARAGLAINFWYEVYPPPDVQLLYGKPWETPRYLVLGGQEAARGLSKDTVASRLFEFGAAIRPTA